MQRDTGPARLPAIPRGTSGNAYTDKALGSIAEWIEVRSGVRGNDNERAVTLRELKALQDKAKDTQDQLDVLSAAVLGTGAALTAGEAVRAFQDTIRGLQLYKDLLKSLNDPSRFDDLRAEVRAVLLRDMADQAKRLGADIQRTQTQLQDSNLSLAMQVEQVTAAVHDAAAGVRQVSFSTAELGRAQAGYVQQFTAQLDSYYTSGQAGVAQLEEQMTVTADRVDGLSSQYMLKVQAGKAIAGIGLSSTEVNGQPDSAFIVVANKFALVSPDYSKGLTNLPDAASIPFGVDANGIYMNSNVYLSGTMRIQGGTQTLAQGLRGSVALAANASAWSDSTASATVWSYLGNAGSPVNTSHIVIGDMVSMAGVTRQWNGSAWTTPGMVLTGDLMVDGSIAAVKVDTRGLVVRDIYGNPILGAGVSLSANYISGLGALATQSSVSAGQVSGLGALATQNNVSSGQVTGLGSLALASSVSLGSTVKFPDGSTVQVSDLVSRLSQINSNNIGVFMQAGAIGNAFIGNAAVGTLQVAGQSVTGMSYASKDSMVNFQIQNGTGGSVPDGTSAMCDAAFLQLPSGSTGAVCFINFMIGGTTNGSVWIYFYVNDNLFRIQGTYKNSSYTNSMTFVYFVPPTALWDGQNKFHFIVASQAQNLISTPEIVVVGGKR